MNQLEAITMADRIVCMNAGRIEQVGTANDLYARPSTTFVAGFIGSPPINMVDARHALISAPDGAVQVGIRPEALSPAETGVPGQIVHVEPMGRETLVTCTTELGALRFLEATSIPVWKEGDTVSLRMTEGSGICFGGNGHRIGGTATLERAGA